MTDIMRSFLSGDLLLNENCFCGKFAKSGPSSSG